MKDDENVEVQDELQTIQAFTEVTSSSVTYLEAINHNIVMGSLFITGALGIIIGCLIGIAFHGIFRSK